MRYVLIVQYDDNEVDVVFSDANPDNDHVVVTFKGAKARLNFDENDHLVEVVVDSLPPWADA